MLKFSGKRLRRLFLEDFLAFSRSPESPGKVLPRDSSNFLSRHRLEASRNCKTVVNKIIIAMTAVHFFKKYNIYGYVNYNSAITTRIQLTKLFC